MRIARLVTVIIVAATAPLFATPRTSSPQTNRLAVQVNLEFDPSITSSTIKTIARDEAAAIWKVYGVDLLWTDPAAPAALTLDVIVERSPQRLDVDGPSVLGHTTIASAPAAPAPIRVSFNAIEVLLTRRHGAYPLSHSREMGTAFGRVLAHEIGHVLLGTQHDSGGLMRPAFRSDDLVWPDRSLFRLMPPSLARLRVRMASWSCPQASDSAARPIE